MHEGRLNLSDATLLAICAAPDADHTRRLGELDDEAWSALVAQAVEQRADPLLQRALRRADPSLVVPAAIEAELASHVLWHARAMLFQRQTLGTVCDLLSDEGLHPVVLKGLRLAYRDYPEPVLRPLRDLDLLLSPRDAERAQELLLAGSEFRMAGWSGEFGVEEGHQLPTLRDTRNATIIEIHHRLNARGWQQEPDLVARMHADAEVIALPDDRMVRVPSSHANLLHLVEHATLHHLFDNGPLILADMHFAASRDSVDWEQVVFEAEALGLDRALRLIAAVAARHGAQWIPDLLREAEPVDPSHLALADAVLVRSHDERRRLGMLRRFEQRTGRRTGIAGAIRAMANPSRYSLAEIARCRPDQHRRWLAYPVWLVRRAATYWAARRAHVAQDEASRQVALAKWLGVASG